MRGHLFGWYGQSGIDVCRNRCGTYRFLNEELNPPFAPYWWFRRVSGSGHAEEASVRGLWRCSTLAPILHWRVCHVWDWLKFFAPAPEYGAWPTSGLADAYGGDEAEEINARTGCVGCPLANRDTALEAVLRKPAWSYLAPLRGLRPIFRELRLPENRLRKPGGETRQDGTLVSNQHRMGPITIEARERMLAAILDIQDQVNVEAARIGRPPVDILNAEEVARVRELIAARTWPQKWTGDEPRADEPFEEAGATRALFGEVS